MMIPPLVTVGVALYNHERYIEQCLTSVLTQTYAPIELIVIDDGSSDNSFDVAQSCTQKTNQLHSLSVTTRPNRGMCNTLNEIAQRASGKYISFLGSDDYWLESKLEAQVAFLESNKQYALVHSNSMRIDADGKSLKKIDYSQKENTGHLFRALVERTGGVNTPSHLYRTSVYDVIGYYDPNFSFEDTDFWLRLCKQYEVGFIDEVHTHYRWHGNNLSARKNGVGFIYDELINIYEKNIDDDALRIKATNRLYNKALMRSLQSGEFKRAFEYAGRRLRNR